MLVKYLRLRLPQMNKAYCNYPWEHIYVHTTGHCKICCMSEDNITKDDGYSHFNTKNDNLLDVWNSKSMRETRLKMLRGEKQSSCEKCYFAEDSGLTSMRDQHNFEVNTKNTQTDGSVNTKPTWLELHFGNVCNLACKMCSQMFSHTIGKELLKIGEEDPDFIKWVKKESGLVNNWTGELDTVYDWFKIDKVKRSIFELVSQHVETLNIIGGEPTVIPEFFELLEYCDQQNTLQNKTVTICTNLTNTNPKLLRWLPKFKGFMIHASIDGLGDRNRYIRYPSNWNTIERSIDFYKDACSKHTNGFISFAPAIQLLNIDQLVPLVEYFEKQSNERDVVAWISHVRYPLICDYDYAPQSYRSRVADNLENGIKRIQVKENANEIQSHVNHLRKEVNFDKGQISNVQKAFMRYNDIQDNFRKDLKWRDLLPDLEKELTKSLSSYTIT